jgi:hypothetical protein
VPPSTAMGTDRVAEGTMLSRSLMSLSAPDMPRLLLIDDDARLSAMVADYLRGAGFGVDTAPTLAEGRRRLLMESFDAWTSRASCAPTRARGGCRC